MNILKTLRKPKFAIILATFVLFVSCAQYENNLFEENTTIDFDTALSNFKTTYESVKPKINKIKEYKSKNIQSKSMINEIELAFSPLIKPSLDLFYSAEFSKEDITEMIGKKYDNNIKTAALGLMFYELTINKEVNSKNYAAKHMNPAIDCFMEATGIAAGIALVGALAGQAGGKALRIAFMRAVKKIGVRVVSGIGLALMAGEFVYCMVTSDNS
jgi:hypothetical protein